MHNSIHNSSKSGLRPLLAMAAALLLAGTVSAQQITGSVTCTDTSPATPFAGITVLAKAAGLGGVQSSITDSNGNYSITILVSPQVYLVTLTNLPAGLSYLNPADGIVPTPVAPGVASTADFTLTGCGAAPTAELGDRVWLDLNWDGIQDWDEPGMPGTAVELMDCDGNVLADTLTDTEGNYNFTNLEPGDYAVRFVAPPGYTFSPLNQGDDPNLDSDADPDTGATICFSLDAGQSDLSWDAGLCQLEAPGVRGHGYWKNHPEEWPVQQIDIGGVLYEKGDAILMMELPTRGNKWLNLFEQEVAAKLNVLLGNESGCIEDTVLDADMWLEINPGPVRANSSAWKNGGRHLHADLDRYNKGHLCAPRAR